jgi:transcriptional regulator with XRE-family HTH domain
MPAQRPPSQVERARVFGRLVAERRERLGMSRAELARLVSLDKSSISRMERGETGPPKDETIKVLSEHLKVDYLELLHAAGRGLDRDSFEERVLAVLGQLVEEQRSGFERLAAALADLSRD